jgi:hypothetical protein
MRLHPLPLVIGDNKSARVHSSLLFWKVESEINADGNPESQQTLEHFAFNLRHILQP